MQADKLVNRFPELNLATNSRLPALCNLSKAELEEVELALENSIVNSATKINLGDLGIIHTGRGIFEYVVQKEAILFRTERRSESLPQPSDKHKLPPELQDSVAVFSNLSGKSLGAAVASELGIPVGTLDFKQFKDGELSLAIKNNIRDREVFLVAGTSSPVNEQLLELFITIDAFKQASAGRITLVMPYFGYARQDKKLKGREPITAKLLAKLLESAGADRVVALEIHSDQSRGFFDIPFENLRASSVLLPYLRKHFVSDDLMVISPDSGGVKRAQYYATKLAAPFAMIYKNRSEANQIETMTVLGEVRGKTCLIVDDMIDTGGTLCKAAQKLKEAGALKVVACCVHPVLSDDAIEKLRASEIEELVTTDSISLRRSKGEQIKVVTIAPLIAEAILRMATRRSVSELENVEVDI